MWKWKSITGQAINLYVGRLRGNKATGFSIARVRKYLQVYEGATVAVCRQIETAGTFQQHAGRGESVGSFLTVADLKRSGRVRMSCTPRIQIKSDAYKKEISFCEMSYKTLTLALKCTFRC